MTQAGFSCGCGGLRGVVHEVAPETICHLVCYCRDCRAFARHLGRMADLDPGGGSALVQVVPARIEITKGADRIGCLRLTRNGLNRWYATCCNTPLANTPRSVRVPVAGMWRPGFAEIAAFGPVTVRGFVRSALPQPGAPRRDMGLLRMLGGFVARSAAAYANGTARQSPFFDPAGAPVAEPVVLTPAEHRAAHRE